MMNSNPWNVGSIDEFSYLNCPECTFHSKEKTSFEAHATKNHPLSSVLFGTANKVITFSSINDLNQLKQLTRDQKCKEIVSKYKLPDNIQVSTKKVDISKKNFNGNIKVEKGHGLQKVSMEAKYKSQILSKGFSPQKEIGKHFALTNQGEKSKKFKKTFPPSKTISHEYLKFVRAKIIPNMEMKTQNRLGFTSKLQTFKKEIDNANLETDCNAMDTSNSPNMKILSSEKENLIGKFMELTASVNVIDPLAIEDQEHEGKQSYGCDICETYFLIKSDLMVHIESVHNESFSDSGIINVKFSTNSPDAVKLQNQNGDKNLNEQKLKSVTIGNVNVISILKKTEPGLKKCLNENLQIKDQSQSFTEEDTDFSDELQIDKDSVSDVELVSQLEKSNEMSKCVICNKKYSNKQQLKRHLRSFHKGGKSLSCGKCDEEFENKRELKGHILSVHKGKKLYRCSICRTCLTNASEMKKHLISAHEKENLMNHRPKQLLDMRLIHEVDKPQSCDQCEDIFDNKKELKLHVFSVHEGKRLYICSICKVSYDQSSKLKTHLVSIHEKDKKLLNCKTKELRNMKLLQHEILNCDQCEDEFDCKDELRVHISSIHEGKKLYRCTICKACYDRRSRMKRHMVLAHNKKLLNSKPNELFRMNLVDEIENNSCNQCGDKFVNKRELKVHTLSVHEGRKLFRCSICQKHYDKSWNVKNHIVSVHGKENLKNREPKELLRMNLYYEVETSQTCDQCSEKFDNKRELKGHVLTQHEGKKLYQCSICKVFLHDTNNMKSHLVSIHGKKNLNYKPKELLRMNLFRKLESSQTCDQCGEKLGNEKELKEHILTEHEGKKLYQCSICKVCLHDTTNMKSHLATIHGKTNLKYKPKELLRMNLFRKLEKSQTCDQCEEKLDNEKELKGHILSVHEGKKVYRFTS